MPKPESKPRQNSSDDTAWIVLAALALLAVVVIPVVLSVIAWLAVVRLFGRREYLVLVGAGLVPLCLYFVPTVSAYGIWLKDLVTGDFSWSGIPVLALVTFVCLFTGTFGLISSSSIATKKLPPRFKDAILPLGTTRADDTESIVPSAETVSRLQPSAPSGGLLVDSSAHSILETTDPDNRTFPLGIGARGQYVTLSEKEVGTHGVILGSTGSGKSKTIEALAGALLDLGWDGMILDLKEDTAPGGLRDWCTTYASSHSLPYQELRLSDAASPYWFNPLDGMGPDEMRDTILSLQEFDDGFWQAINKELLGQAINLMVWAHQADPTNFPAPTMYDVGKLMSTGSLPSATKKARAVVMSTVPGVTDEDFRVLSNPSKDQAQAAVGFGSRITQFYDTQAGRTVLRPGPNGARRPVDVTTRGITYIGLDSLGKADLTKVISSSVLQRMSVYAAQRTSGGVSGPNARAKRFLIVDEANWVDRTIVQNLLSRARSAGIAVFLCTQGPKDWVDQKGDDWGKLTQNTNVALIMRQGEPIAAEMCADYIGTHRKTSTTRSRVVTEGVFGQAETRDSSESDREIVEHLVDPETIRRLKVGEAIVKVGVPARVEWARISMRDPKAQPRLH